ncbi:hypothetical protein GCM10007862_17940 [Dyella lipolytica]|nr:hypothetical protein GCM10007862_17940 [Dyella lipolytica]
MFKHPPQHHARLSANSLPCLQGRVGEGFVTHTKKPNPLPTSPCKQGEEQGARASA